MDVRCCYLVALFAVFWGCGFQTPEPAPRPRLSEGSSQEVAGQDTETQASDSGARFQATSTALDPTFASGAELLGSNVPAPAADAPPVWRPAMLERWGIRQLQGKWITILTDLPRHEAIEELPRVYEQAVRQWCSFFQVPLDEIQGWHMVGYLIGDRTRFAEAGILADDLPPFLHGYQRGREIWWYDQPSDYYRRHLLLHEGTHGFMQQVFGGGWPPWYVEGMAELLATHSWDGERLQLKSFPQTRDDAAFWGRIKVIRDDVAAGRGKTPAEIMHYDQQAHLRVEPYAWCWVLAAFLDAHPACTAALREGAAESGRSVEEFNQRLIQRIGTKWPFLLHHWQYVITRMDYGFDFSRELLDPTPLGPFEELPRQVTIHADRGWQSTGCWLESGATYAIEATGRFQLAREPAVWWSEANGVTLRYYHGLPLGMLLGAILDDRAPPTGASPLARPDPIGQRLLNTVERSGVLYLRLNDDPSELVDNEGSVTVTIRRAEAAATDSPPN